MHHSDRVPNVSRHPLLRRVMLCCGRTALVASIVLSCTAPDGEGAESETRALSGDAIVSMPTESFAPSSLLRWDAISKESQPKPGESQVRFEFTATNLSPSPISILAMTTSCGCTVAQLPPLPASPFKLAPGATAVVQVTLDVRGKAGVVAKRVRLETSVGIAQLTVQSTVAFDPNQAPAAVLGTDRPRNLEIAVRDRQAIFQGDCARCHAAPAAGKMGEQLYLAVCTLCHDAHPRASLVPDLDVPRTPRDLAFWVRWIADGGPGTMMPAFAETNGGPLTAAQVSSLARYLYDNFPRLPPTNPQPAASSLSSTSSER